MPAISPVAPSRAPDIGRGGGDVHTVVHGDTMWDIARANGVSLQSLEAANPQIKNPDLIYPGDRISIPGRTGSAGGTNGTGGVSGSGNAPSGDIAATAEKYLGQNASSLKGNTRDNLPMNANVPSDICCANFVSAVLTESGHLPKGLHTDSVAQLQTNLKNQGWQKVSLADAKPGDVVIMQGGGISHTEIVTKGGQMIGSNNTNADGSQRIGHNSLSYAASHGGVVWRAPGGNGGGDKTQGTGGTSGTSGPAPTGQGTHQQRINQAMSYFQSHGWSKAQAAGIVANLDAESGMEAGIRQHGGGPGYGLAQWEGPRQAAFKAWAGRDIHGSSFKQQLDFVQHELTTSERGAGNALKQTNSASDAGSLVCRLYERPADTAGQSVARAHRAAEIYGNS